MLRATTAPGAKASHREFSSYDEWRKGDARIPLERYTTDSTLGGVSPEPPRPTAKPP